MKTSYLFSLGAGLAGFAGIFLGLRQNPSHYSNNHAAFPLESHAAAPSTASNVAEEQARPHAGQFEAALSIMQHEVHALTAGESLLAANDGALFFAYQPENQMTVRFRHDAISFKGKGGSAATLQRTGGPLAKISAAGPRVSYARPDGSTEWFENGPQGMEHGLTLAQPLNGGGELTVGFDLAGLVARADAGNPQDLILATPSGEPQFAYRDIKAWDANGKMLAAAMHPTAKGFEWRIDQSRAAFPITIDPLLVSLTATMQRPTGTYTEQYGYTVAIDGDSAAVGCCLESTPSGDHTGAAYLFKRTNGVWAGETRITDQSPHPEDAFGLTVCLSGDLLAVCGARDDEPAADVGSVQIFARTAGQWNFQAQLTPPDPISYGQFGAVMAMDGNKLAVGQTYASTQGLYQSGAVYTYENFFGNWSYRGQINSYPVAGDIFGAALAMKGDTLAVSAPNHDRDGMDNCGAVYLFRYSGIWSLFNEIRPSDAAANDNFGSKLALESDRLLVGAGHKTRDGQLLAGGVYQFSGPNWTRQSVLNYPATANAYEPGGLTISGRYAAINSNTSAKVRIMQQIGSTWIQRSLLESPETGSAKLYFGNAISLNRGTLIVGAPGAPATGRAYLFDLGASAREISVFTGPEPDLREISSGEAQKLGDVYFGETKALPFFIVNDGRTPLTISSWELLPGSDPGFGLTTDSAATTLEATGNQSLQLSASFTTPGVKTATLRIHSDDADEASFDVPISVEAMAKPAPLGLRISRTNGQTTLTYPFVQGVYNYRVQRSLDLNNWISLGYMYQTFDAETSTIRMQYDEDSSFTGQAFYRIVLTLP